MNKALVQRQFERCAPNYDRIAGMQRQIADQLFCSLGEERVSIADLGCGTGYALGRLSELGFKRLAGLDIASSMIDIAKKEVPAATYHQGDIEALPYRDGEFTAIFSSSAIQWCDLRRALLEMHRVLAPGGQLLLSSFVQGTLDTWRRLWRLNDDQRFVSLADFSVIIDQVGFVDVEMWSERVTQRFTSFEQAVRSIRDLGAGHNGRDQRRGLMGRQHYALIKSKVEHMVENQGFIELDYQVVFVSARKKIKALGVTDD